MKRQEATEVMKISENDDDHHEQALRPHKHTLSKNNASKIRKIEKQFSRMEYSENYVSTSLVRIEFVEDLETTRNDLLMQLFKQKMSKHISKYFRKSFSSNFDYMGSLFTVVNGSPSGSSFKKEDHHSISNVRPCNITISYQCHCILVSDCSATKQILVFDLDSKLLKKYITTPGAYPMNLCLDEEDFLDHSDRDDTKKLHGSNYSHVMFDCNDEDNPEFNEKLVFKYDLKLVLRNKGCQHTQEVVNSWIIWKSDVVNHPRAMKLQKKFLSNSQHSENSLFICDSGDCSIKQLNATTGEYIQRFNMNGEIQIPSGIASMNALLMVTRGYPHHDVVILRENTKNGEYTKFQSFELEPYRTEHLSPCVVIYDQISKNIIVGSCSRHHRNHTHDSSRGVVQVFAKRGKELMRSFSGNNSIRLTDLYGMCLNEWSGELYICDSSGVHIFQ